MALNGGEVEKDPGEELGGPLKCEIAKVGISNLVPHEGILDWHLKEIKDWIGRDGFQERPIAVSSLLGVGPLWSDKFMIHDGHHRTAALKDLGCSYVMCSVFDFKDPRILVFDYDTESIPIPKEAVIGRAISGVNLSPRFDKHFFSDRRGKLVPFHNNPAIEPKIMVKLSEL